MTCDHEWETWAKSDPFDYGYRCRKCGMRAEGFTTIYADKGDLA